MQKPLFEAKVPRYPEPKSGAGITRPEWRKSVYESVLAAAKRRRLRVPIPGKVDVHLILYLSEAQIGVHDLDNQQKDIFDALGGRLGGKKAGGPKNPRLIDNDHDIFKVTVEKRLAPTAKKRGEIIVRRYRDPR